MIVISSNRDNLKRFLQNDEEDYFYVSTGLYARDIEEFLKDSKYKEIDISEGRDDIDFSKEYVDFIGRLNRDYNSLYWWANTASYKGSFSSNLCKDILNYYCAISLIKRQDRNYIILNDNFIFSYCIKSYCKRIGLECKLLDARKRKGIIVHLRRCLKSNIYFVWRGWTRKIWTSLYLSKNIKGLLEKHKFYYIIRSWVDKRSFPDSASYEDQYFHGLPEYLKKNHNEFIVLIGILTDYRSLIKKIKHIKQILIIPQEYFAGYLDYLKVIVLSFLNRPRVARPVLFCGLEVTHFLRDSLKKDYECGEINKNLIYYYFVRGLLRKLKVSTFLYPFENQSWEKMSIFALRGHSPFTRIIGYAHSAFSPFLIGYVCSREEKNIISLPDKIVTVGKRFKEFLERAGNYKDGIELSEGCALRFEHIFKKEKMRRNKNGKILATLSMDFSRTLKILKFLCDALAGKDKYKVLLRPHPFTPLEIIIEKYSVRLGDNFQVSKNLRFEQDLRDSSLVIYADTTCSMKALMCGVPVVHLDFKEFASADPLFELNSLKWTVSDKDGLCRVIDCVYNMDESEYLRGYNEAMAYMEEYFYPIEERYLKEFINND